MILFYHIIIDWISLFELIIVIVYSAKIVRIRYVPSAPDTRMFFIDKGTGFSVVCRVRLRIPLLASPVTYRPIKTEME